MAITVANLNKQLKKEIKRVYLFYGAEKYLHSTYIERIKNQVLEGPFAEFNYSVFEEKSAVFEDFLQQLNTYPQMSEKKLILLKNTEFLCAAEYQKKMEEVISGLPDYAVLIFSQLDEKRIKKSLISLIASQGTVAEFKKQGVADLRSWVGRRLASSGKRIKNEDAEHLINICERSLERLEVECDKLAAAAGDSEIITARLIDEMVSIPLEFKIYSMADKLLSGDDSSAYAMLREFKINKEQPTVIIALIYSQLSMLYMFRQIRHNAAPFLPPNRKFLAGRLAADCMRHDEEKLRYAMRQCAQYENDIKNGKMEGWTALELIMAYLLTQQSA